VPYICCRVHCTLVGCLHRSNRCQIHTLGCRSGPVCPQPSHRQKPSLSRSRCHCLNPSSSFELRLNSCTIGGTYGCFLVVLLGGLSFFLLATVQSPPFTWLRPPWHSLPFFCCAGGLRYSVSVWLVACCSAVLAVGWWLVCRPQASRWRGGKPYA
jgi:hypothetical protein